MIANRDVQGRPSRRGVTVIAVLSLFFVLMPVRGDDSNSSGVGNSSGVPLPSAENYPKKPMTGPNADGAQAPINSVPLSWPGPYAPAQSDAAYSPPAGAADIVVNATVAPTPPDLRVTGFWAMDIERGRQGEKKGFMVLGFESAALRQRGFMMFKTDQVPLPFSLILKPYHDDMLVEFQQDEDVFEGRLNLSANDTRGVMNLRSRSDGKMMTIKLTRLAGEQLRQKPKAGQLPSAAFAAPYVSGAAAPYVSGAAAPYVSGAAAPVAVSPTAKSSDMVPIVGAPPARVNAYVQSLTILRVGDTVVAHQPPQVSRGGGNRPIAVASPMTARVFATHGQTDGHADVTLQFFDADAANKYAHQRVPAMLHVELADRSHEALTESYSADAQSGEADTKEIDGQWKRVYYRRPDGFEIVGTGPVQASIAEGIWKSIISGKVSSSALVTIDPKSDPKTFTTIGRSRADGSPVTVNGIYRFDGNTLELFTSQESRQKRPPSYEAPAVYERWQRSGQETKTSVY